MSRPQERPSLSSICEDALRMAYPRADRANITAAAAVFSSRVERLLGADVDIRVVRRVAHEVSTIIERGPGDARAPEPDLPKFPIGPYDTTAILPEPRPEQGPPSLSF